MVASASGDAHLFNERFNFVPIEHAKFDNHPDDELKLVDARAVAVEGEEHLFVELRADQPQLLEGLAATGGGVVHFGDEHRDDGDARQDVHNGDGAAALCGDRHVAVANRRRRHHAVVECQAECPPLHLHECRCSGHLYDGGYEDGCEELLWVVDERVLGNVEVGGAVAVDVDALWLAHAVEEALHRVHNRQREEIHSLRELCEDNDDANEDPEDGEHTHGVCRR